MFGLVLVGRGRREGGHAVYPVRTPAGKASEGEEALSGSLSRATLGRNKGRGRLQSAGTGHRKIM